MEWLKIWDEGLPVVAKNANTKDLIQSVVPNVEPDLSWMKRSDNLKQYLNQKHYLCRN